MRQELFAFWRFFVYPLCCIFYLNLRCKANVFAGKNDTKGTWLYELIRRENSEGAGKVDVYMTSLGERDMTNEEQQNVALLMWKCLPSKAVFAQTLNGFLVEKMEIGGDVKFKVPTYIKDAINHLVS